MRVPVSLLQKGATYFTIEISLFPIFDAFILFSLKKKKKKKRKKKTEKKKKIYNFSK